MKNYNARNLRRKQVEEDEVGGRQSFETADRDYSGHRGPVVLPVKRYLQSQIGQPWDDIYSKLCKTYPKESGQGQIIFRWLKWLVEKDIVIIENWPHSLNGWSSQGYSPLRKDSFYIDPQGILRKVMTDKPEPPIAYRYLVYEIDKTSFAVQNRKGIWFLFKYSDRMKYEEKVLKVVLKYEVDEKGFHKKDEAGNYICTSIKKPYIESLPYFKEVYIDSKDFELLPGLHKKNYPYGSYTSYSPFDHWGNSKGKQQWYYLVSVKTMNHREKKQLGIV